MSRPTVRLDLSDLDGYHSPQLTVAVRLNTNEAPDPPPEAFTAAVQAALSGLQWHRYPDRAATELRRGVGRLHDLPLEQVFCANGSNEVLQTILLTYAGSQRSVATFEPTYTMHGHIARISGATNVVGERRADFALDLAEVKRVMVEHRPAVTFLCSPNNPTGMVETEETVTAVLEMVEAGGGLLVVDEAYGQFAPWSATELLADDRSMVVTRTFSKTWAMAGARLGYLLGPAWLVAELGKVVLPYHLDSVKQIAGLVALDFVDAMEQRVASIVEERDRLQEAIMALGATVWPSAANFILFRPPPIGGVGQGEVVWEALVARSVLVRNTSSWDRLEGCLRVTVGTKEDNNRFLDALAQTLDRGDHQPAADNHPTQEGAR